MKLLLIGTLFVATLSHAIDLKAPGNPECNISHSYDVSPLAPTFILRSGYSRDNDDPVEGNYETAVFDLELLGRTVNERTCLYLVNTITLSSEANNAGGWVNQFFIRRAGSHAWNSDNNQWIPYEAIQNGASRLSVLNQAQASYLSNQKYVPFEAPRPEGRVALFNYTFLGSVPNGRFRGRVFYQAPTRWMNGQPLFENRDDSNYNLVRHVLEWSLTLRDGKLEDASPITPFKHQVRFLTPSWNGSVVALPSGPTEIKKHSVKLMWRDIIQEGQRIDLYQAVKSANPPCDEVFGRCAIKPPRR